MAQEAAAQFDDLAALYEDMASWPFRRDIEIPSVLGLVGETHGRDLLDFGCGTGMYARWLKARGARRVVGYDLAEGMLNYARRRAGKEGADIAFVSSLGPELAGAFDLVLSVYVLPYARTRAELSGLCRAMFDLLRPGGRVVALPIHPAYEPSPPYYEPYGFRLVPEASNAYEDGGQVRLELCHERYEASVHAWYWRRDTLERAMREAGAVQVDWHDPVALGDRSGEAPPAALRRYVERPHAVLMDCRKG